MLDNNAIVNALRSVKDPKSGQNILTAKMVEDLRIEGNNVFFSIVLKSNDQEMKTSLNFACMEAIAKVYPEANVNIHLKLKSDFSEEDQSILPQVKNVIAVASGKGGVGKSTVSANIATSLAQLGAKVGLLDADIYGPSIPTMMGAEGKRPKIEILYGKHKIVPVEAHGVHLMSVGFVVEPEQAIVLRGPRLGGLIRQFLQECLWPELDYLIIDLPPGTGDVQLTLVQMIPVTGVVMVTTPQKVALIDAVKAMNMFLMPNVAVPIVGVVENMSWFTPEELPDNKYFIFGQGGGKSLAAQSNSVLLGQIPLVQSVREAGDSGAPISLKKGHPSQIAFENVAKNLMRQVYIRNETLEPTRIVKMQT